jgi:hypothetical protein
MSDLVEDFLAREKDGFSGLDIHAVGTFHSEIPKLLNFLFKKFINKSINLR